MSCKLLMLKGASVGVEIELAWLRKALPVYAALTQMSIDAASWRCAERR
jgi:hypothetical protein